MPVDVEVDNEARPLLVVLKPVESEPTPLCAVLIPVDVEVDNEATLLFVVLKPVDNEATPLCAVLIPVDVDVESELNPVDNELTELPTELTWLATAYNSLPLTASVLVAVIRPAATFVICRSAPTAPTLTTLLGVAPAKPLRVVEPTVALLVGFALAVTEPLPSATSPALLATAFGPIATLFAPSARESASVELAWKYLIPWLSMLFSAAPTLLTVLVVPFALYVV